MGQIAPLLIALCCAIIAFAQPSTGSITGKVLDQSGAVVAAASISAVNTNMDVRYETHSNALGSYLFPTLLPGTYRVEVEKAGFARAVRPTVVVHVQDRLELNIELAVASVLGGATVEGVAPMLNTQDAAVSTIVKREFIENTPLNGRSVQSLILLGPGVVATKARFSEQGQFSVNGQRGDANYYTVDGVSANFSVNAGGGAGQAGGGLLPALNVMGGFSNLVSIDALKEFRIQTSTYAPEFGRTVGGQISFVTRSGSNDFHGSVFEYLRNDVLDANDWFANRLGLPRPKERQSDFGAVLGGPLRFNSGRARTFFFLSYEGLRLRLPRVTTTFVPSLDLRESAPPDVRTLLDAFPLPNGGDAGNGLAKFTSGYSDPTSSDGAAIRIDRVISENFVAFARYSYAPSMTAQRDFGGQLSNPATTRFQTQTLTVGLTVLVTPNITNDFRGNWSRQFGGTFLDLDGFGGAKPLASEELSHSANSSNALFSVSVINPTLVRYSFGRNGEGIQRQINFVDSVTLLRGNHQIRMGLDVRRLTPSAYSRAYDLSYIFSSAADVQMGRTSQTTVARRPEADYGFWNLSAYAQDTWRPTGRLTITHGVRWELNPAPHGRNGLILYAANETDTLTRLSFAPPGTPLWDTTYANIAPRIGVAYKLSRNGLLVIRGGFGVFYDLPAGAISSAVNLSPNVAVGRTLVTTYPATPSTIPIPALTTTGPFANVLVADPRLKLPYSFQWNVGIANDLGNTGELVVCYVGSAGRRLLRQERVFNANPTFPLVQIIRNSAVSDYNALQLQFQHRGAFGLQLLASYTWSHSLDTASGDSIAFPPASKLNVSRERGSSDFDIRHSLSATVMKEIHFRRGPKVIRAVLDNWSLSAIAVSRSAPPVDVVVNRDLGFGTFNFRPDIVLGSPVYVSDANFPGGKRFNSVSSLEDARQLGPFVIPEELRQGNLGRNVLRGFGAAQLDVAVRRQFNLTKSINVRFSAEFFNICNHPNFGDPSGTLGAITPSGAVALNTGTFGWSSSMLNRSLGTGGQAGGFSPMHQMGGPRSVQFSLRIGF